jgi:hypothetical protein
LWNFQKLHGLLPGGLDHDQRLHLVQVLYFVNVHGVRGRKDDQGLLVRIIRNFLDALLRIIIQAIDMIFVLMKLMDRHTRRREHFGMQPGGLTPVIFEQEVHVQRQRHWTEEVAHIFFRWNGHQAFWAVELALFVTDRAVLASPDGRVQVMIVCKFCEGFPDAVSLGVCARWFAHKVLLV